MMTTQTKANHVQAGGAPAWFRPYSRAQRALAASIRLIGSTLRTVAGAEHGLHRRPIRTSRNLQEASARLVDASARLRWAAQELAETNECIALEPERAAPVPELLIQATEHWMQVAAWLQQTTAALSAIQGDVLLGLQTGLLVPEHQDESRPRIRLAPRPVPIRAFLLLRQPRVSDRISPILRRRRRMPRPRAVRVPRCSLLGRAPPLFPISLP